MNGFNWLDIAILGVLFFYGLGGYSYGFARSFLDLAGFLLSFFMAVKFYGFLGAIIASYISIPQGIIYAVCFFLIAIISEMVFGFIIRKFLKVNFKIFYFLDKLLGSMFGIVSGIVLIAFLLTLVIALPVSSYLKDTVYGSKVGSSIVERTQGFEKTINGIFGGAVNETLSFLTIEPNSDSIVDLHFKVTDYKIDEKAEGDMFDMVNLERLKEGADNLISDKRLQEAARNHCIDMVTRGYFSHYTPEGLSPFDRMNKQNIYYVYAGENLAFSPNVVSAMQGLMNSPGHKANILSKDFGKIGVGVISAGFFGEAFCQEFTD